MAMAIGSDITIPQNPAIIPPAVTLNITINGWIELVLPYTLGPIKLPSNIGHTIHIITVRANNFALITEETNKDSTATMKPPNHGIIADRPIKCLISSS